MPNRKFMTLSGLLNALGWRLSFRFAKRVR
jgi:hypothetical protein